jgi:CHASE3 domain sensor protein
MIVVRSGNETSLPPIWDFSEKGYFLSRPRTYHNRVSECRQQISDVHCGIEELASKAWFQTESLREQKGNAESLRHMTDDTLNKQVEQAHIMIPNGN